MMRRHTKRVRTANLPQGTVKDSRGIVLDSFSYNGYVEPNDIVLTDSQARQMWRTNVWVKSVVRRIVADCTKIQPIVRPRDNKTATRRQKKRIKIVQDFFMNPNDNNESFADIREKCLTDCLTIGRQAQELVYDQDMLSEIYALNASLIKIRSDIHGNIPKRRAYKMTTRRAAGFSGIGSGSQKVPQHVYFDRDEMIYLVKDPVSWSLYGHKPLDTLAHSISADILRGQYNANYFVNSGEAAGILSLEGMGKGELRRFRNYYRAQHQGVRNAHRTMAVNVPIKYVQTAISNRDMQFHEYGTELRSHIFAAYCMQPIIMGITEKAGGKTSAEQQIQSYKDGALLPLLAKEAHAYTTQIVHEGFGFTDLEVVFPGLDILDAKTQAEIDRSDVLNGIITINEVRERRHLQPVPWGDTPVAVLPGGNQIDPNTGRVIPPSQQQAAGTSANNQPKPNNDKKPKPAQKYIDELKIWAVTSDYNKQEDIESLKHMIPEEQEGGLRSTAIAHMVHEKLWKMTSKKGAKNMGTTLKRIDRFHKEAIREATI